MNEIEFIELALRYLDGVADQAEVDRLGSTMLDDPGHRARYRELVQQSQDAHEWLLATATEPATKPFPIRRIVALAAAAAALVLVSVLLLRPTVPASPRAATAPSGAEPWRPDWFDNDPSWSDIWPSPFDYPSFVWPAEIPASNPGEETTDQFSDSGIPPLIAASLPADFSRLLEPIVLLPSADSFGDSLFLPSSIAVNHSQ